MWSFPVEKWLRAVPTIEVAGVTAGRKSATRFGHWRGVRCEDPSMGPEASMRSAAKKHVDDEPLGIPKSIAGWTLRAKRGYWELVKRQGGRVVTKYVGKDWKRAYDLVAEDNEQSVDASVPKEQQIQVEISEKQAQLVQEQRAAEPTQHDAETVSRSEKPQPAGIPCQGQRFCLSGRWCVHKRECWGTR